MALIITTNPQQEQYDRLVSHPIQSWAWGSFRQKMGVSLTRFIINNEFAGQVFFYKVPHLSLTIGHCPKINFINPPLLDYLLLLNQEKKAIFTKIEPQIISSPKAVNQLSALKKIRPSREIFSRYTMIIDLTQTEEELLAGFTPKTRYNLRLAQKKGVKVRENNSNSAFEIYWQLTKQTTARQGFYAHNKEYHQKMWQTMSQAGLAHLFQAEYQQKIIASWILFKFKNTLYYPYGASSREYRNIAASNLLMWEAIRFGKNTNCHSFDLWGTSGPNPKESDSWYGFHRFKSGYNPKIVKLIGAYDLVTSPNFYRLYRSADRARQWWLKLKTKT